MKIKLSVSTTFLLLVFLSSGILLAQERDKKMKHSNRYMQLAEEALSENNFALAEAHYRQAVALDTTNAKASDRKSTRLNSSHVKISYAVFCLKKKSR